MHGKLIRLIVEIEKRLIVDSLLVSRLIVVGLDKLFFKNSFWWNNNTINSQLCDSTYMSYVRLYLNLEAFMDVRVRKMSVL